MTCVTTKKKEKIFPRLSPFVVPYLTAQELIKLRPVLFKKQRGWFFFPLNLPAALDELLVVVVADDKVRLTNLLVVFATAAVMIRLAAGFLTGVVVTFLLLLFPSESEKMPLESVPVEVTMGSASSVFFFVSLTGAPAEVLLVPNQWGLVTVLLIVVVVLLRSFLG